MGKSSCRGRHESNFPCSEFIEEPSLNSSCRQHIAHSICMQRSSLGESLHWRKTFRCSRTSIAFHFCFRGLCTQVDNSLLVWTTDHFNGNYKNKLISWFYMHVDAWLLVVDADKYIDDDNRSTEGNNFKQWNSFVWISLTQLQNSFFFLLLYFPPL